MTNRWLRRPDPFKLDSRGSFHSIQEFFFIWLVKADTSTKPARSSSPTRTMNVRLDILNKNINCHRRSSEGPTTNAAVRYTPHKLRFVKQHCATHTFGGLIWMTRSTSGMSMPLAATFVATRHFTEPSLNAWKESKKGHASTTTSRLFVYWQFY